MPQASIEPTETTILLPSEERVHNSEHSEEDIQVQQDESGPIAWPEGAIRTVILATAFLVFFALADILKYVSSIKLIELGICREHYRHHDPNNIPERLCKTPEIQQQLAQLRGYLSALEAIVGLVLTLPYGLLVDWLGERLIAGVNVVGYLLSCGWIILVCYSESSAGLGLPIWTVVLAPLFRAIGGGAPVLTSVIYSIAAKKVPGSKRSQCFFVFLGAQLLTGIIAAQLTAVLLDHGYIFAPLMLNFPIGLVCLLVLALIPRIDAKNTDQVGVSVLARSEATNEADQKSKLLTSVRHSSRIMAKVVDNRNVTLLLATVPIAKASNSVIELMFQYVPKKFDQSFATVSRILSVSTFESLVLLLFVLPFVKNAMQNRFHIDFTKVDLYIVQYGFLVQSLGCLLMAVSQTLALFISGLLVFSLGCSTRAALQSLITGQVSREHISVLYTIMAIGDGLGSAVDALILNRAFALALGWDNAVYLGLPFLVGGICFFAAFGGSLTARHK
ncbi:hypothetical protein N0V93_007466 [Gnomoniopsis smithogilvyi]|uniref:MFS transporter n=1 Tax=Gnomoniopsis smithogilvyi TaxID=1191159 RepID=A0A9W8YQ54_9PEZI|nr:hypothetical protein N0V93_007466 [Gnomoniopsis smithogilvyi]